MSIGSFAGRLAAIAGIKLGSGSVDQPTDEVLAVDSAGLRVALLDKAFHGTLGPDELLQLRRVLFWIAAAAVFLFVAAITNPTEQSFRSHLTELSFRRHLAGMRASSDDTTRQTEGDLSIPSDATVSSSGSDTPTIAPFRFANHVAISLRTPPLWYKTLFFLSFALTSPLGPPAYLSDPTLLKGKHAASLPPERVVLFVGYFGHWVYVGQVPRRIETLSRFFTDATREKGRKKNALLDRPGITELRSVNPAKDDATPVKPLAALPAALAAVKNLRRNESTSTLADHGTLPLHAPPAPIPVAPFMAESRRSSLVTLNTPNVSGEAVDTSNSPLIIGLKADLSYAQTLVSDVKAQLLSHEESVSTAHSHLQASLDQVRTRRKEDDAERQELKSRTKHLEEQKRQAEAARREAEKRLRSVEAVRDGLEAKISSALAEIKELKGLMVNSTRNIKAIAEDGEKFVSDTREAIEEKRAELVELEGDIGELDARNEELGRAIKEAEEKVEAAIRAGKEAQRLGPEEEMMMMAAAYEAAANEGYQHAGNPHGGYRDTSRHASGAAGDPWANQAAAYMAEAGMPYLDQNYTARPSHSTTFGPFAKLHKMHDDANHKQRNNGSADLAGFEGFGPGARGSGGARRPVTPPASDSGSDVWGHDPGSPNGGISASFTASLLPQGLFRSLEGDQTPLDARTELSADDNEAVGDFDDKHQIKSEVVHGNGGHDSESESSDEPTPGLEKDHWVRSPVMGSVNSSGSGTIGTGSTPLHPLNPYGMGSRNNSERHLLAPASHAQGGPGAGTPVLPGLPALPGSRRWLSGVHSDSAENLGHLHGFGHSNDSLGYEASPFAPSQQEKQQLALKWGALSKRWARPLSNSANANNDDSVGVNSGGGNWFQSRLSRRSADIEQNRPSVPIMRLSHDDARNYEALHVDANNANVNVTATATANANGNNADTTGGLNPTTPEKKPFRFFSLRRPTSSGSQTEHGAGGASGAEGSPASAAGLGSLSASGSKAAGAGVGASVE